MKKTTFTQIIKALEKIDKETAKLANTIKIEKFETIFSAYEQIIGALNHEYSYKEHLTPISHYVFESDFGKKLTQVYEPDTEEVIANIITPEDLYNYVTGDQK